MDLKKGPTMIITPATGPPAPKIKHSILVIRTENDKFEVVIEGTNNRHDVKLLLRAVEKEVNIRKRRAIPLTQSASV